MDKPVWGLTEAELARGWQITAKCEEGGGTGRVRLEQFRRPREEDCACRWRAERLLTEAGFPARLQGKTLADLAWDWLRPSALAEGVRDYAQHLEAYGADGIGMVLHGRAGNGKTHVAVGLGKLACSQGQRVAFVSLADTLEAVRAAYDRGHGAPAAENPLERLVEADWLILDDLGTESDTPWGREKVYQLINQRWSARKPILVTPNRAPDDLARRFGEGVVSRLWGDGVVLHFQGEDYRLAAKAQRLARVRGLGARP